MKRTLLTVIAVAALAAGCGTDGTPVAVSSLPTTSSTTTSSAVKPAEVTTTPARSSSPTTTSNWDPNSADPVGDAAQKEAERQAAANPDGSAKLAIEYTKLTGEKLDPVKAQLLAGYVCVIIELTKLSDELNVDQQDIVDETSREMAMSKEDALRLLTLAVKYRCPDSAFN